ncbi:MAG: sugar transferase [Candidatus Margulisiibacteriota bacterium]
MKQHRFSSLFSGLYFVTDCILIPFIVVVAYGLKFKVGWVFQHIFSLPFGRIYDHAQVEPYLNASGLIIVLWVIAFYFAGVYRPSTGVMTDVDKVTGVVKGVSLAALEMMAVSFLYHAFPGSRFVIFYAWGFGILLLSISHLIIHHIEVGLLKRGIGSKPTLIIGADTLGQDIAEKMILLPTYGFHYVGTLDEAPPAQTHFHLRDKLKYLGTKETLPELVKRQAIKTIFVTSENSNQPFLSDLLSFCQHRGIDLRILSNLDAYPFSTLTVNHFDGMPFISHEHHHTPWFEGVLKRGLDLCVSAFLLVFFFPIFCVIGLMIKLSSEGPVFYTQERVTQNDRVFKMIKFRTMVQNAEAKTGPTMVNTAGDDRYVPFGPFLRKTSLDELPQLINVFKGDMSLVGPRPERPFFVQEFEKQLPHFKHRHVVKAGITGWAQINGRSTLTHQPEHKLKYDLYYIQNASFIFDLKILLKTVLVVFRGEEAY